MSIIMTTSYQYGTESVLIQRKFIRFEALLYWNSCLSHNIKDSFSADIKVKIMRLIPQGTEGPGLQNWYWFYEFYINIREK